MLTNEQASRAAGWWAGALRCPKFDTLGTTRSDPGNQAVALAELMAADNAANEPQQDETIEAFRVELEKRLLPPNQPPDWLSVDYGPDRFLAETAEAVGLSKSFPWKTCMWFEGGGVQVSHGYGAPTNEILKEANDVTE